jgi:muramoyltetrapeptide carboxypeptidase
VTIQKLGIAVVAPGGYAPEPDAIPRGIARLEAQGILVHNYYRHEDRHQRFGATDAERLAQLEAAAADPDVQVVMALRGAYGMTRLLPDIDFERMAASGKIFDGYSDITAFHMGLYAKTPAPCSRATSAPPSPMISPWLTSCAAWPGPRTRCPATAPPTRALT